MKLKAVLLASIAVSFLILANLSFAQVQWYRTYNGPSNSLDWGNQIQADDSGFSYITGSSEEDFLTIKYDANGNVEWAQRFGNPNETDFATGLALDCYGNVYVSGITNYFIDPRVSVVKYDSSGNQVWYTILSPQNLQDNNVHITTHSGRIYIAVASAGPTGGSDIAVTCFDENGTQLWNYNYNTTFTSYNYPVAIASDRRNVYVAGKITNLAGTGYDFGLIRISRNGTLAYVARHDVDDDQPTAMKVLTGDNVLMTGFSSSSIVTMRFDQVGRIQWSHSYIPPGMTRAKGWAISIDSAGNPVVAAESFNGVDNDFTTLKFKPNGQLLWSSVHHFGYDEAAGLIATDACGNIHVAGASNSDTILVVYDTKGNVIYKDRFVTTINQPDYPYLMDMNRFGNLFIGGITDPGQQLYDYLLIKFDATFCSSAVPDC